MVPIILAILSAIAVSAATVAVIEVIILLFEHVLEWFNGIDTTDIDAMCFTVLEAERAGQVTVIQGVLDRGTGKVVEGKLRRVNAHSIDDDLASKHRDGKVVVYT